MSSFPLGGCAAEGASAATPDKPVSPGTPSCAQGPALGWSAAPSDPRFSSVSLRCLLPRRLLAVFHKTGRILACAIAGLLLEAAAAGPEPEIHQARADADGVQRVSLVGGSYFFRPGHIAAQAGQPLEMAVSMEPGLIPHRFVLEAPDGQQLANLPLGAEAQTVRLTLKAGDYVFYCPTQLLQFKSHRERGMAGVLQMRE